MKPGMRRWDERGFILGVRILAVANGRVKLFLKMADGRMDQPQQAEASRDA